MTREDINSVIKALKELDLLNADDYFTEDDLNFIVDHYPHDKEGSIFQLVSYLLASDISLLLIVRHNLLLGLLLGYKLWKNEYWLGDSDG